MTPKGNYGLNANPVQVTQDSWIGIRNKVNFLSSRTVPFILISYNTYIKGVSAFYCALYRTTNEIKNIVYGLSNGDFLQN